jgi:hypothetical protein
MSKARLLVAAIVVEKRPIFRVFFTRRRKIGSGGTGTRGL